jgi:phosphoglycolate phosphatase
MKYKMIIFDFDGTLVNSFPWFVRMVNTIAAKYDFKQVATDEVEGLRGLSAMQLLRYLEIPLWKLPMIANYARNLMSQDRAGVEPFAGVDQLLATLHEAGMTLALVTSNSYENVVNVLGADNLALMSYMECDASVFGKRQHYRRVLKQSGIRPQDAISIGDEIRDIEASTQEHIPFGAVAWGYTHVDALKAHAPAEVFTQLDDILGLLA